MFALRTLVAFVALFATTAAAHAGPIDGMSNAPVLSVAGETAYVLAPNHDGQPGELPTLEDNTTVIMLGSRIGRVPSANLEAAISNGFFKVAGTIDLKIVPERAQSDLIERASLKLDADELSALLSPAVAVAQASSQDDDEYDHLLDEVMRSFRELMERFHGPLKFLAADGTEFDCYGEYVEYQWGGVGLPCR